MRPQPQEINIRTGVQEALPRLRYEGPYKKAIDVAEYYGFRLIPTLRVTREDRDCTSDIPCPADRVTLLREYLERGMDGWAQPVQLCHTCKVPYQPMLHFRLEAVGSKKSIAEAMLIHTAYVILREYGHDNIQVAVNSVGGKESLDTYLKELVTYYKEHLEDIDADTRQEFMNDAFAPLRSQDPTCIELKAAAPKPISFLTEASRQHLADVLEHLETFSIPYFIQDDLVGSQHHNTRTIFAFYNKNEELFSPENALGFGERYDNLARNARLGRRIPAVGLTIDLDKNPTSETITPYIQNRDGQPIAYVVQVGPDARRGGLQIIEQLRQADIPVAMSFTEEKLSHQMKHAEHLDVSALVIIGQKEINEGTAIIRSRTTHMQKIVSQTHLPSHLKRLCALY